MLFSRIFIVLSLIALPLSVHAAVVGKPAPIFEGQTATGETITLKQFAGKYVVLEWSNYHCPFVRKHYDSGNMQKLQETYTGKEVVWLTVMSSAPGKQGYYEQDALQEANKKNGNKASHVIHDADGTIGKAFSATSTPHMFIIAPDQTLAYAGAIDSIASANTDDIAKAENYVEAALESLMAGKAVEKPVSSPYGCSVKY